VHAQQVAPDVTFVLAVLMAGFAAATYLALLAFERARREGMRELRHLVEVHKALIRSRWERGGDAAAPYLAHLQALGAERLKALLSDRLREEYRRGDAAAGVGTPAPAAPPAPRGPVRRVP
jgi:hypothetical protein